MSNGTNTVGKIHAATNQCYACGKSIVWMTKVFGEVTEEMIEHAREVNRQDSAMVKSTIVGAFTGSGGKMLEIEASVECPYCHANNKFKTSC